jgi:hypothetical protein
MHLILIFWAENISNETINKQLQKITAAFVTKKFMSISVRFFSLAEKYSVPQTPILIPVHLKAAGLSEIIHHLLALESPVSFEFLIDGTLLRSSIEKYLDMHHLSTVIWLFYRHSDL